MLKGSCIKCWTCCTNTLCGKKPLKNIAMSVGSMCTLHLFWALYSLLGNKCQGDGSQHPWNRWSGTLGAQRKAARLLYLHALESTEEERKTTNAYFSCLHGWVGQWSQLAGLDVLSFKVRPLGTREKPSCWWSLPQRGEDFFHSEQNARGLACLLERRPFWHSSL